MNEVFRDVRSNTMTQEDWDILDEKIKICPFCGEKKGRLIMSVTPTGGRLFKSKEIITNRFYVICLNDDCLAQGGFDFNPYKAVEKWNRRVN